MKKLMIGMGIISALTACGAPRGNMQVKSFGKLADGRPTKLYTLYGSGGLIVDVTDYGGRIVRVYAPDRFGNLCDVALGWNTAAEYEKFGYSMGTLIGRFGNRIADGKFKIDGVEYQLPVNETSPNPRHCSLHSGPNGWDSQVWKVKPLREKGVAGLILNYVDPDGNCGFPGTVKATVIYRVLPNNVLTVEYEIVTDKPTVINPTHHGYWNMAGEASGNVLGQELQIFADQYTETTAGLIPTKYSTVEGTGFDFREMRRIDAKKDWMDKCEAIKCTDNWYDHNFVLRYEEGQEKIMKPACKMRDPKSGRAMEIWTTEPCMQMYGAQNMDGTMPAKAIGATLPQYAGMALETQHTPDSPNHPEFLSTVLRPGEVFKSRTEYRFLAE